MLKKEVVVGGIYVAKVSGVLAVLVVERVNPFGGWDATNVRTKRSVRIKSAARFRWVANDSERCRALGIPLNTALPVNPAVAARRRLTK